MRTPALSEPGSFKFSKSFSKYSFISWFSLSFYETHVRFLKFLQRSSTLWESKKNPVSVSDTGFFILVEAGGVEPRIETLNRLLCNVSYS